MLDIRSLLSRSFKVEAAHTPGLRFEPISGPVCSNKLVQLLKASLERG